MSVAWAATSPVSGRFAGLHARSNEMALRERFDELRSQGQGYLEVELPGNESALLTLGFRRDYAVIHLSTDPESMSLLVGDGTVPPDKTVRVLIMEDLSEFTGDVVVSVGCAWEVVLDLIRGKAPSDLGKWWEL